MLRSKNPKQKLACTEIRVNDVSYKDNNIANGFSEYFKGIFAEQLESNTMFSETLKSKLEHRKSRIFLKLNVYSKTNSLQPSCFAQSNNLKNAKVQD